MQIVRTISDLRDAVRQARAGRQSVALVPTMGALHDGHLSLMRAARKENGFVVASVFVNPTQFAPDEDFGRYPRRIEEDARLASAAGVSLLFAPEAAEMYPGGPGATFVVQEELARKLCGRSRPTHFRGVLTVVAKLFHLVAPDRAYFGQKDAQQALLIRRMVDDLNFPLEVRVCPIVREEDGLARSSRNENLAPADRRAAPCLYRALAKAGAAYDAGERRSARIIEECSAVIRDEPLAKLDYFSIVDLRDLEEIETIDRGALAAVAACFGNTRLIDNVLLGVAAL
ncbi:MAG: pantoate--beta-alanine ligase [Planctomycetota bacterium]